MSAKKQHNDSALKIKWALMCKSASVDRQSNNVSLFSVIEELTLNKTPAGNLQVGQSNVKRPSSFPNKTQVKGEFTIVVQLERQPTVKAPGFKPSLRIQIVDPKEEVLATNVLPLNFEEGKNRLRAIVSFDLIIVKDPGIYNFAVSVRASDKDEFGAETRVPVEVKIFE